MQAALAGNDAQGFSDAMNDMLSCIGEEIRQEYDGKLEQAKADGDKAVLASRGVRQLTSTERQYYQKLGDAMRAADPRQALTDTDIIMPETVIDAVFDELQTAHPLLSRLRFTPTRGAIKMLMNTNGYQEAAWGPLCGEIVKEILSGFKEVNAGLLKLSAFLPVCKATLELGPEWLDSYIRQVLYEALSNGLEVGIVKGDGNEKPIGMMRQVGDGVSVTNGAYPAKTKIAVTDFSAATVGKLLSLLAVDPNGKPRAVRDLLLIVNPQDYFQSVMPATTVMAPDGTFRNDVLPYPMAIVQSAALERGEAVLGLGYKYFAAAGMDAGGRIEYSDHYQFLEDNRVYIIKLYANGFPMDNNSFLYLDISGLRPAAFKVEMVEGAPSDVATLADLKIGSLEISPAFASETTSYTVSTTNATNTITATPSDAGEDISITVGGKAINNGSAAEWAEGANTVTVGVTAADGKTEKTYTVAVTKS